MKTHPLAPMTLAITVLTVLFLTGSTGVSQEKDDTETASKMSEDETAVHRAVLDYVEGVYEMKPELIERSVHPEMKKFGFWRAPNEDQFRDGSPMTFKQLKSIAATYNRNGHVPKDAPKEVQIFDVMDRIASAKLTAHWGTDYFQLIKEDGNWKIFQIVWQSPTRK